MSRGGVSGDLFAGLMMRVDEVAETKHSCLRGKEEGFDRSLGQEVVCRVYTNLARRSNKMRGLSE